MPLLTSFSGLRPLRSDEQSAVGRALGALFEEGQRAWPTVALDPATFGAHLAAKLQCDGHETATTEAALKTLHGAELYLACACSQGDRHAIVTLETAYASHIEAILNGFGGPRSRWDDLRQIVRERLFVPAGTGPARIAQYSGQGSLAAWLRVTARRALLNFTRGDRADGAAIHPGEALGIPTDLDALGALGDVELLYLKQSCQEEFRDAFVEGIAELGERERSLLRQAIVHQLNVRQIGRMYRVHPSTAARWIAGARVRLVELTRAALQRRLDISIGELDSIMRLVQSRLDVSVARLLDTPS
ncbi:MAG: transcriptional regulator [Nannocystaceae bacterium]|nr:transcriptional regulator [Nannocystaceae bacterium]